MYQRELRSLIGLLMFFIKEVVCRNDCLNRFFEFFDSVEFIDQYSFIRLFTLLW